jgi:hypothetical protein
MKKLGSGIKMPDTQHFFFSTVKFTHALGYGSGIRMNQKACTGSGSSGIWIRKTEGNLDEETKDWIRNKILTY